MSGHSAGADLSKVPAQDPIVKAIEEKHDGPVKDRDGLEAEYGRDAHDCEHHQDVAYDTKERAQLVQSQKPFVDLSAVGKS